MLERPCPFCGVQTKTRTDKRSGAYQERSQVMCIRRICGFRGPFVYGGGSARRANVAFEVWSRMINEKNGDINEKS